MIYLSPRTVAAVWAVCNGARTFEEVATMIGCAAPSTAMLHLRKARDLSLVAWEDGKKGTLRPLVRFVGGIT